MIMHDAIRIAYERGYRVSDNGVITSPYGNVLKLSVGKNQYYPTFSIAKVPNVKNKYGVFGIPAHKFAAYCFYGEDMFDAECVRHLNSNVLDISKNNLVLGTHSENNLDKLKEVRVSAAKKARAAQGKRPKNSKFSDDDVRYIRSSSLSDKQLSEIYNVTRQAIWLIRKGRNYGDVS